MGTTETERTPTAELYWQARGAGPEVLLIPGTPGDGGQFDDVVRSLAEDHLVIAYDRRGTSRSDGAQAMDSTSVAQQAQDAAGVLSAVGVRDASVFGTSNGAAIALELGLRHPDRVRAVMLHEPPLVSVLQDPTPVMTAIGDVVGGAMEMGGPRAALEAFLRFAFGDQNVENIRPDLRDRMLANAEMVFAVEMPAFQPYRPDPEALAGCRPPVVVFVGEQQELPFFREAAEWLARRLGAEVRPSPGAHGPQFSHPEQLASVIREFTASA
jgi:pimeloyl-ACP methyl ester carboxylesterase